MNRKKFIIGFLLFQIIFCGCESKTETKVNVQKNKSENETIKTLNVNIIRKFPHDSLAFTQGLTYYKGYLYESTGQEGQSSLRKVNIQTGEVIKILRIPDKYFGEGSTILNNKLYYFTWLDQVGWMYNPDNFEKIGIFCYDSEGWGLTNNGEYLIMSDGTNLLRFKDSVKFNTISQIEVFNNAEPLKFLNELEYVNGLIYANIWGKDAIAVIDEKTGNVNQILDLSFLRQELGDSRLAEVLNGIAYIPESDTFILTGKNWPLYFEVKIK